MATAGVEAVSHRTSDKYERAKYDRVFYSSIAIGMAWLTPVFHDTIVRDSMPATIAGAWRVVQTAARAPGESWVAGPGPQSGIYVFSARHYSYFYVPGTQPRAQFADANRPTAAEKAAAYDTFIAGAGTYTFDGRTLEMTADLRKNPNEMTGGVWRFVTELRGDTLSMVFPDPPFLSGREWRTTLVRIE